jgi:DNA-binding transcriptional regulator YiaG
MDAGLTAVEVATRLGVNPMTVRLWEAGRTTPGVRLMAHVIAFVGFDRTLASGDVASRLRGCRRRWGWSQADLALALGVHASTVERWESRRTRPTFGNRVVIQRLLSERRHGVAAAPRLLT